MEQGEKLRAGYDLKESGASSGTAIHTSINLQSWDHTVQICTSFRGKNSWGRPGMTGELPLETQGERVLLVRLTFPFGGELYGFVPRTQRLRATAASLHYKCASRMIAPSACGVLIIPCVGCYGVFGIGAPQMVTGDALPWLAGLKGPHHVRLKVMLSGAGHASEFLGVRAHCPDVAGLNEDFADIPLSAERRNRPLEQV